MDKILSARLDEAVLEDMDRVTRRLNLTKKEFLEGAIRARTRDLNKDHDEDVWSATFGAWKRREGAEGTVRRSRKVFEASFRRHQKRRRS